MPGSAAELQTVAQNIAQNVNTLSQTLTALNGTSNTPAIAADTLVSSKPGRLVTVSITTPGTTAGAIYDSSSTTDTSRPIYTIPNTTGIVTVNFPMNYGIFVSPGTGQVVAVSYS